VGAEGGDEDGAAIAVVTGIVDVLQAGSDMDAAPGADGVVSLQNSFAAVVQVAIAEEKAQTAVGEVYLMVFLDGVRDESEPGSILLAVPPCAACANAGRDGLINLGIGEGFSFAVVPTNAGKRGDVAR
jgi:hypothetical protein